MVSHRPAMTARQSYLDSHPSVQHSMEDFEAREFSPTMPDIPSQHSGFRSHLGSSTAKPAPTITQSAALANGGEWLVQTPTEFVACKKRVRE